MRIPQVKFMLDGSTSLCIESSNEEECGVLQKLARCRGTVTITVDVFGRMVMTFKDSKH